MPNDDLSAKMRKHPFATGSLSLVVIVVSLAFIASLRDSPPQAANSAQAKTVTTCRFVKVFELYGSSRTVTFIEPKAGHLEKDLIDCAVSTMKPGTQYVYFFIDEAKAKNWAPKSFGPGPQHEGCIGRAYQDKPGEAFMYTPQSEW